MVICLAALVPIVSRVAWSSIEISAELFSAPEWTCEKAAQKNGPASGAKWEEKPWNTSDPQAAGHNKNHHKTVQKIRQPTEPVPH